MSDRHIVFRFFLLRLQQFVISHRVFVPCQALHINIGCYFKRIVSYWIALRKAILFIIHNLKDSGAH